MSRLAASGCFHCAEALPPTPVRETLCGQLRDFCCHGCAGAAQWIEQSDLDSYYQLRNAPAARVGDEPLDLQLWDRPELQAEHSTAVRGGREITVLADGMHCAACAWLIDRALAREPGVIDSTANAITGRVRIAWDPGKTRLSDLLQRLAMLGYRPYLAGSLEQERQRRQQRRTWILRLGIAGLGTLQAMMFAEALYLDVNSTMSVPTRDFFRWLTFLTASPVVFYSGWPFLAGAWRELRQRHLGMDTLIAGSSLLAYFASLLETIRGGVHVWFDAAVMFIFLLLLARMLEQRARAVANAQVDALARVKPAYASREGADGSREPVPLAALQVGDVLRIGSGDNVAADGVLLDADAWFEEALLTGESQPVHKRPGEPVFAGATCREHPARMRVTGIGSQTRLSQLVRLVEQAQAHRPTLARVADQVGSRFVGGLLLAAVAVFLYWHQHAPQRAFEVTLALLVISCPCALSLSVPSAIAAAHGALSRLGVLALRPDALERLASADHVGFDKTGTLTDGRPLLASLQVMDGYDREHALAVAAALERDSGHPIAHAFVSQHPFSAKRVHTITGRGVYGCIDGREWRLGQRAFVTDADADRTDDDAVWLACNGQLVARFVLQESIRSDAAAAIAALREQGHGISLLSGDSAPAVVRVAGLLGITDARSRQTPSDKLAVVKDWQRGGKQVLMIGDGVNDAPVLAGADVSIAMSEGAALAHASADLVMTGPSLSRIPAAITIARKTRHIIRQNLAWATLYNLLALPLAAMGWVTPWLAALGMALSSLVVTLNALRLSVVARDTTAS